MPLSPPILSACQATKQRLEKIQLTTPNSQKDRQEDTERDLLFFREFFNEALTCDHDHDFIEKLFEIVYDFQFEKRYITNESEALSAALALFIQQLNNTPYYSIIKKNIELLKSPTASLFNMDPNGRLLIEKYKIIIRSYLNELDIVAATELTSIEKFTYKFSRKQNSEEKIKKTKDNPKVLLMQHLVFDADLMLINGQYIKYDANKNVKIHDLPNGVSKDTLLTTFQSILENREQYWEIAEKPGHFFNTISFINSDILSELSSGKTLGQCPTLTYEQMLIALTNQFNTDKKAIMKFEPSHLAHASSSSFTNLMNAISRPSQTLGGEGESIIFTSIRQNINAGLHRAYKEKKESIKIAYPPPADINSFSIEQEILENNEVLLFHGTTVKAAASIFFQGFSKPTENSYLSVVGSLGPGIYLSDSFVKSGTFSTCVLCGAVNCSCQIRPGQKIEHCVILCKVILGNLYATTEKIRKIPTGFDCVIGVGKHKNPNSAFNSTEICIRDPKMILPLFEIKYFTYENMLMLEKWPSGVTEINSLIELIKGLINAPETNRSLRAHQIKKECEQLLVSCQLALPLKTKLRHLIDQINIEENQKTQHNRGAAAPSTLSNMNNSFQKLTC